MKKDKGFSIKSKSTAYKKSKAAGKVKGDSDAGSGAGAGEAASTAKRKRTPKAAQRGGKDAKASKKEGEASKKEGDAGTTDRDAAGSAAAAGLSKQQKRKRKRQELKAAKKKTARASATEAADAAAADAEAALPDASEFEAWSRFDLHPHLLNAIRRHGFKTPTPVQEAAIPGALHGARDVVGIAETGSGKTLAYGLPIVQTLMQRRAAKGMGVLKAEATKDAPQWESLPALILCPTRELVVQVAMHLRTLTESTLIRVGVIVGGLATQKQERVLRSRPDVIVATPGRLWDLISGGQEYLQRLSRLQFLVLDEADRLMEAGSYPTLDDILKSIRPNEASLAEEVGATYAVATPAGADDADAVADGSGAAVASPAPTYPRQTLLFSATLGMATESDVNAATQALIGLRASQARQRAAEKARAEFGTTKGARKARQAARRAGLHMDEDALDDIATVVEKAVAAAVQVATGHRARKRAAADVRKMSPLEMLRVRTGAVGSPVVVEVVKKGGAGGGGAGGVDAAGGSDDDGSDGGAGRVAKVEGASRAEGLEGGDSSVTLPPGLALAQIKCVEEERDQWLYYFLLRYPGRTLIFVNTISMVRSLTALLTELQLPVSAIHAQMQQKQRLRNLERFKKDDNGVLVATDVAARGLDIPMVSYVVHYHLPEKVETFVHRSGRTARAMGEGLALCFVSPQDQKKHSRITFTLGMPEGFEEMPLDRRYERKLVQRLSLARKLSVKVGEATKQQRQRSWLLQAAKDADLVLDDDMARELGEDVVAASKSRGKREEDRTRADQERAKQRRTRKQLGALLRQPLLPRGTSLRFVTHNPLLNQAPHALEPFMVRPTKDGEEDADASTAAGAGAGDEAAKGSESDGGDSDGDESSVFSAPPGGMVDDGGSVDSEEYRREAMMSGDLDAEGSSDSDSDGDGADSDGSDSSSSSDGVRGSDDDRRAAPRQKRRRVVSSNKSVPVRSTVLPSGARGGPKKSRAPMLVGGDALADVKSRKAARRKRRSAAAAAGAKRRR